MGKHFDLGSFLARAFSATLLAGGLLTLAACGSGGTTTSTSANYVSGVAANGVPLVNATVTLTDANGVSKTTTTDPNNGSYTLNVTGLQAPFVIRASGISGDAQVDMTSMLGTGPLPGQVFYVDITPLTNAMAAVLSHTGEATALTTADVNSANLSGNLSNVRSYIVASMGANTLGYGGLDPVSTQFLPNGTGYDGLLDNLAVIANPGGGALIYDKYTVPSANVITTTNLSVVDDSGEMNSLPTAATVVAAPFALTQNNAPYTTAVTTLLDPTAVALPGTGLRATLGNLQTAFNGCFAVPSASRGTVASPGSACTSLVNTYLASNYLNDGVSASQFSSGFLQNSSYDAAVFDLPFVVRYVTPTKAIVHVSWLRGDGLRGNFETTAVANASNVWQLAGNGHQFDVSIRPVAEMRQDLGSATTAVHTLNAYTVGLRVRIAYTSNIMWAQVSGKGLGASNIGAVLMPQSGCSSLTFVSNSASGYGTQAANASGGNCDDYYRLDGAGMTGAAITWPSSNNYAPAPYSPVDISLFEPYSVHVRYCSVPPTWTAGVPTCSGVASDAYYVERPPSPVPTVAEAALMSYPAPDTTTQTALTSGALASVAWDYGSSNAYALPVDGLDVQIVDGSQAGCPATVVAQSLPFSASLANGARKPTASATISTALPAPNSIGNANCSGQNRIDLVKYSTHRRDGLLVQSVIEYANY